MTEQDKLIKIIGEAYGGFTDDFKKRLSKQLLDNGVVVPLSTTTREYKRKHSENELYSEDLY